MNAKEHIQKKFPSKKEGQTDQPEAVSDGEIRKAFNDGYIQAQNDMRLISIQGNPTPSVTEEEILQIIWDNIGVLTDNSDDDITAKETAKAILSLINSKSNQKKGL